ncbi:hypothetical protein GE107_21430 [Cohnella sp. CFH 77786]|uniref:hypothetical protein n=1 Tax=Cohnella sp. CFH 77786 TaxID=2662265 RepID=UPI001C60B392|nr:hypothetical protein [Cohnella sp. CFH 77786]MBW5448612.1 hypothetical protein [Cohnella sp. CFH 77786]
MARSKVWLSLVAFMLTTALLLAGCNSNKSPQEALKAAMIKSAEMKSYSFKGSMKIEDLSFQADGADAEQTKAMLSMFKDTDISWTGAYKADPMHVEMTLSLAMKGDMAVNFNIPIIMEKEKMWVKIPNIPFFPLPQDMVGKFLELDLKKMAEESGEPMPNLDPGKSQKFANDILAIIFNNVDEKQYLSDVKVKDAGLPEGNDVKQVIRFQVNKDQVEPFANTVVEKIAPEIIDLLSKNAEYRDMLGLKQEDLDQAKKELGDTKKEDITKGMEEFKKAVKTLEVTANVGIDAKEYPVYSDMHVKASVDAEGDAVTFAFKVVSETKDINKDVKLEYPEGPKDVVTMEQFEQQMGGAFGTDAPAQGSEN